MATNQNAPSKLTLAVSGMSCGHCRAHVQQALTALDGVREADVELATGRATVVYDASVVTPDRMAEAVREAGYRADVA